MVKMRTTIARIAAALLGLVLPARVQAEILPTGGTFEGTYHQDRWGVGRFEFFIATPELLPKLKPYEGKRVRIDVTKGDQPLNPGPAIMHEVANITPLPESMLDIAMERLPASAPAGTPFQLVCLLKNRGTEPLYVANTDVNIDIMAHYETPNPANQSWIKGYTNGQLSGRANGIQMYQALVKTADRISGNLHGTDSIRIEPADCFPLVVLFDRGLAAGEYEFAVSARGRTGDGTGNGKDRDTVTVRRWFPCDIPDVAPADADRPRRLVLRDPALEAGKDLYQVKGIVAPADDQRVRIVQRNTSGKVCWEGRVRATTDAGEDIPIGRISQPDIDGPARLAAVPATGLPIAVDFSKATRFSTQAIRSVYLDLLGESGVETLAVTESFAGDVLAAVPPFGPDADGVRLRIRPASDVIRAGEPLRLHVQAINTSGKPVCWWQTICGDGRRNAVEVDGQAIRSQQQETAFVDGWAGAWTCREARERTIEIPGSILPARPGQHTIRVVVLPQRGHYDNANNQEIPLLKKRLMSNAASFAIQEAPTGMGENR